MPATSPDDPLALVHLGWDHLKHQRPLAAWACWRRALQVEPEYKAATHALHVLANAGDLPEAAKLEYKFLTTADADRRGRWDRAFRGRNMADLAVASEAFGALADSDEGDGRGRYNQGICLAWLGRNGEAVEALDRAVRALGEEREVAIRAWSLAEVLRQGGGAEPLADDLNHVATLTWDEGADPLGFLDDRADVRGIPNPVDPVTNEPRLADAKLYEWLDLPPAPGAASFLDVRRVRATVVRSVRWARFSGLDPSLLESVLAEVAALVGDRVATIRREATPLPLAFLDAAVWAIRIPEGTEPELANSLNRAAVERYYEASWIHRPRRGLGGLSPIEAAGKVAAGDAGLGLRLEAVVRVREQLGERPTTALLYQGYPFDRLRRRLGLPTAEAEAIDPADPTCMAPDDLDRLDPGGLDDFALADAYESAAALGDDARTARFAAVLAARDPSALARLDVPALFATLIRSELAADSTAGALGRVDQALAVDQALTGGRDRRKYQTWRAEILVRVGDPEAALLAYDPLLKDPEPDPKLALDAAELLLDSGFDDQARKLARVAVELAEVVGDRAIADRAESLL